MYQMNGFAGALVQTGAKMHNDSWKSLEIAIAALTSEQPIAEIKTNSDGLILPLDQFLSQVRGIHEADSFFHSVPEFNIWTHLPIALDKFYEKFGLDNTRAKRALDRFNFYTFSQDEELRKHYFGALTNSFWVAKKWRSYMDIHERLGLASEMYLLSNLTQVSKLESLNDLVEKLKYIKDAETQVATIPKDRFRDMFTRAGWRRQELRQRLSAEYIPKIKKLASEVPDIVSAVGVEYRLKHS